jgi:hypothetical protein
MNTIGMKGHLFCLILIKYTNNIAYMIRVANFFVHITVTKPKRLPIPPKTNTNKGVRKSTNNSNISIYGFDSF